MVWIYRISIVMYLTDILAIYSKTTAYSKAVCAKTCWIGTPDPGDQVLYEALKRTGLVNLVSSFHPRGLDLQIQEGGKGLSGGQKQLVAFTRILLCNSDIILLDEPTASMDDEQERRCLNILANDLAGDKTLIVVTHKTSLLPLVNRLVITGNQIVLDGRS